MSYTITRLPSTSGPGWAPGFCRSCQSTSFCKPRSRHTIDPIGPRSGRGLVQNATPRIAPIHRRIVALAAAG
jgi:hypothetical protein